MLQLILTDSMVKLLMGPFYNDKFNTKQVLMRMDKPSYKL